jgi:hypothetical protein
MLAQTAESLARTARELEGISPEEAAAYLKKTPKAFGRSLPGARSRATT